MNSKHAPTEKSNYDSTLNEVTHLAEELQVLSEQALQTYTPIVEQIVSSGSCDTNHIEHTLDGLLSFCGYAPPIEIFKKLCRYYWQIDPSATASYIKTYREMWDS